MEHNPCLPQAIPNSDEMEELLQLRVQRFEGYKRGVLTYWIQQHEGGGSTKEEKKGIIYPVAQFMKLINILLTPGKNISGVRIYFATYYDHDPAGTHIPKGYDNLMTVIFAPTRTQKNNSNCDKKEKNSEEYYILKPDLSSSANDDVIQLITDAQIRMKDAWIAFHQNKMDALEDASGHTIKETKSIWFDKDAIQSWDKAIKEAEDPIVQVILGFASYIEDDLEIPGPYGGSPRRKIDNKLSIVLSISSDPLQEHDIYFVPRSKIHFSKKDDEKLADFTGYYDTGKPCPPPTTGCS